MVSGKVFQVFFPLQVYESYMLPCQPEFQSNRPQNLCSTSPYLMMLFMKSDQIWPIGFRDKLLWKCGRPTDHIALPVIHLGELLNQRNSGPEALTWHWLTENVHGNNIRKVKINLGPSFELSLQGLYLLGIILRPKVIGLSILETKILISFYLTWHGRHFGLVTWTIPSY